MTARYESLQAGQTVWLAAEILEWDASASGTGSGSIDWRRQYEPYLYATRILKSARVDEELVTTPYHLKRAVEFRETALKKAYSMEKIAGEMGVAPEKILHSLDIVLPIMHRKLISLRDEVTHNGDASPPDINRCKEFAEFTWYFLKCTDRLLTDPIVSVAFDYARDSSNSFELNVDPAAWSMSLVGAIPKALVREGGDTDGIKVTVGLAEIVNIPRQSRGL
jgi:hypothetical protein